MSSRHSASVGIRRVNSLSRWNRSSRKRPSPMAFPDSHWWRQPAGYQRVFFRGTYRLAAFLLQGPEQEHLCLIGKVAYLVQKQCPSVNGTEQSDLVAFRTGKGSLLMTENSEAASSSEMAPQSIARYGLFFRWLRACISAAMCSFPVPEAPRSRTEMSAQAIISIRRYISWALGLSPR